MKRPEEPTRRADDFARRRICRAAAHARLRLLVERADHHRHQRVPAAAERHRPSENCAAERARAAGAMRGPWRRTNGRRPITCAMYGRWSSSECSRSSTARSIVSNCPVASSAARAPVHRDVARRRRVRVAAAHGAAGEVGRVARPEEQDAPHAVGHDVAVRPRRRRPAVRVARVRRDQRARGAAGRGRLGQPEVELAGELVAPRRVPRAGVGGAAAEAGHRAAEAEKAFWARRHRVSGLCCVMPHRRIAEASRGMLHRIPQRYRRAQGFERPRRSHAGLRHFWQEDYLFWQYSCQQYICLFWRFGEVSQGIEDITGFHRVSKGFERRGVVIARSQAAIERMNHETLTVFAS